MIKNLLILIFLQWLVKKTCLLSIFQKLSNFSLKTKVKGKVSRKIINFREFFDCFYNLLVHNQQTRVILEEIESLFSIGHTFFRRTNRNKVSVFHILHKSSTINHRLMTITFILGSETVCLKHESKMSKGADSICSRCLSFSWRHC